METPDATLVARPRASDLIPGYRLEVLIGRGGMGEVYRATQLSLGRTVAIKLLSNELAKDKAFVARFEKEAAVLAALSHPNVVSILDRGRADQTCFLVMEHIDGRSLREVIRTPTMDNGAPLRTALQICRAVEYAHGRGVIHRDLKPENILFDEQAGGIPKVTDFGLANFTDIETPTRFHLTESHMAMGTFAYMAPEQRIDAGKADHRADIYSLGVILFELLVGELPMGSFEPPSRRKPGLDKQLDLVVGRCLKSAPDERYQSATELIAELEPMVPISSTMFKRELSHVERFQIFGRRLARTAARVSAVTVVIAAILVLIVSALRSRSHHRVEKMAGEQIAAEFTTRGLVTAECRRDRSDLRKSVSIGQGPDRISVLAYGRPLLFEGGTLKFWGGTAESLVGRAVPDISDNEGRAVRAIADVEPELLPTSLWARFKRAVLGDEMHPRAALLLAGTPGRYAALVLSGRGEPVSFEWALGERRGLTWGSFNATEDVMRLELAIDASGDLHAYAGNGKDRRLIGEPISLGSGWRKHFGEMPVPTLGCIEGNCQFRNVLYDLEKELKTAVSSQSQNLAPPSVPAQTASSTSANHPPAKSSNVKHASVKANAKKAPRQRAH